MTEINKVWHNYKKPVPIKFRKIGDFALVISTFLSGAVMGLPIEEHTKLWIIFVSGFTSTVIKFWANSKK